MATYLCSDARFRNHQPPGEHPERPERLSAVEEAILSAGLTRRCRALLARPAANDELFLVHSEDYIHGLEDRLTQSGDGSGWLDPDTYYSSGTWEAARYAAGGAVDLALKVLASDSDNGLGLLRPPGHHASRDRSMGFCLINNIAVAAAVARARGARVAIVDFDVHHGNGTEDIFAKDPDVLFVSLHQFPFYPGTGVASFTGEGLGRGATMNIPLPQGCDDAIYRRCFKDLVKPYVQRFAPDLILVSAGFDGHRQDPLAGMALSDGIFGEMVASLLSLQPRLVALLEGGYNIEALSKSVVGVLTVLLGERPAAGQVAPLSPGDGVSETLGLLRRLHNL